jgi:hypothetical protein
MRKKRTTGSRFSLPSALRVVACLTVAAFCSASSEAWEKPKKEKPKKEAAPYAVITGTVFREEGFALAGSDVTVSSTAPQAGKKQRAVSDARGEFAVRVPAVPAEYTVSVHKAGFAGQEKTVKVEGEGSFETTFRLSTAGKEGAK